MQTNAIDTHQFLIDLHTPRGDAITVGLTSSLHDAQIRMIMPLYKKGMQLIMVPSARKVGKSHAASYVAWRQCCMNPHTVTYLIGPEKTHIADIYWDNQRIQRFLGDDSEKYILKIKDRERMIIFKNGSILKLMGSENWKAAQGLTPDLLIYDEYKHFHPKFHPEMAPNVAAKGAKLFIVGTPPQVGDRNKIEYEGMLTYAKENPDVCHYEEFNVWDNPIMHLDANKRAIEADIARLRAMGDEASVQREYFARIVPGGSRSIFPMFTRDRHVKRHDFIMDHIKGCERQFDWYCVIDPAGSSTYAVTFIATHTKSKQTFLLDELYIKDRMQTSTKHVIPMIKEKMQQLNPALKPRDWIKVCDEQASHHIIEIITNYPDMAFIPSQKLKNDKDEVHMTLKDMFTYDKLIFSDKCKNAAMEVEEYATSQEGVVVKNRHSKDHILDCLCYFIHTSHYTLAELLNADKETPEGWQWHINGFKPFGHEEYRGYDSEDYDDEYNLLNNLDDYFD